MDQQKQNPSLQDVIEWNVAATMFIATNSAIGPEMQVAVDAVHQLTILARQSLAAPTETQVKWSIQNDPYCYAAYAYGASKAYERGWIDAMEEA